MEGLLVFNGVLLFPDLNEWSSLISLIILIKNKLIFEIFEIVVAEVIALVYRVVAVRWEERIKAEP